MRALAEKAPTRELPDWLVRIGSWFEPGLRQFVSELGKRKRATGEKACRLIGWNPRPGEDAVVATAESLARLGLVKAR
jgi:dihydroflavonol-4-reductase